MASQSPMYRAFVEVVPEASGFTGALTGQVTASSAAAGAAGGKAAGTGFVTGFGKAIPLIGAGLAALGLGDLIGDALNDASNFQQASGAVEDVFGPQASKTIQQFAKKSAKSLGLSGNQALTGAKDFGVFGAAAGLAGEDLAGFSTDLLTLSADLAAFANTSPEEAVTAIAAGLRGESEPLRRYGVLLDDATLRQKALELGIYDGNGSLTQQQKILAANAEIFDQTGTQQGKFADEADSLAGTQAILAASWEDISTQLGTAFLPIAQEVVDWISSDMIPTLEDFSEWLNDPETQESLKAVGEGVREFGNFTRDAGGALAGTVGLIQGAVDLLNGEVTFDDFKERMTELPGPLGDFYTAVEDTILNMGIQFGVGLFHVRTFFEGVSRKLAEVVLWFADLPNKISTAIGDLGSTLYNSGRALIEGFLNGVGSMWTNITDTVGGVMDFIAGFFPNSPADRGPFSGAGWAKVKASGAEIGAQLARGIESQYGRVALATGELAGAAQPDGYGISGTLEIGGDGLGRIVDGRIYQYDAAQGRGMRGRLQTI